MVEGEYVDIQEAARRCEVSGKTIQRAIQAGKLPVQYPKLNQRKTAISALEAFRPGQVSGQTPNPVTLECRIATLECRFSEMEHLVEQLQRELLETKRRTGTTQPHASRSRSSTEDTPLSEGLIPLQTFVARTPSHQTKQKNGGKQASFMSSSSLKQEVNGVKSSPLMSKNAMTSGCNFTPLLAFGPEISARIQHQDRCLDNNGAREEYFCVCSSHSGSAKGF